MTENQISYGIIGKAIEVHKRLGPGLLESVYETGLAHDLRVAGFEVRTQVRVHYAYKSSVSQPAFRLDLLVNDLVIVEVKAVERLDNVHFAQTLTYLKLSEKRLALLINFNVTRLKDGVHRLVNNLQKT